MSVVFYYGNDIEHQFFMSIIFLTFFLVIVMKYIIIYSLGRSHNKTKFNLYFPIFFELFLICGIIYIFYNMRHLLVQRIL